MFNSSKRSSEADDEKAKKRLCQISIPQLFAWTGLEKTHRHRTDPASLAAPLEGLPLWNILGFALSDVRDFDYLSRVDKEWNQIVKTLEPPVIFRMKAKLNRKEMLTVEDLALFNAALHFLGSKTSKLYRTDSKQGWPLLQPQFGLVMVRYAYSACTQRKPEDLSPEDLSKELYDLVADYFGNLAEITADKTVQTLQKDQSVGDIVKELVDHWEAWNGIVGTVIRLAGYVDRYHVAHHDLPTLKEKAQICLTTKLLAEPAFGGSLAGFLERLDTNLKKLPPALLSSAFRSSQTVQSFCSTAKGLWNGAAMSPLVEELYEGIRTAMESHVGEEPVEERVAFHGAITIGFSNKTTLELSPHFVSCSGLIRNLNLCPGDTIHWGDDTDLHPFQKAIEFYAMDAQTPMPAIETPLRSSSLPDLVGPQFAQCIQSMSKPELFAVVAFANFLDMKKLLDAAVLEVTSARELREIFNIDG
jgi:hypothetical protein